MSHFEMLQFSIFVELHVQQIFNTYLKRYYEVAKQLGNVS